MVVIIVIIRTNFVKDKLYMRVEVTKRVKIIPMTIKALVVSIFILIFFQTSD